MSHEAEPLEANLRVKIFTDILNSLLITRPALSQSREHLARLQHTLTLGTLLFPSCGESGDTNNDTVSAAAKGGLTEMDIRRFTSPFTPKLDVATQNLISQELESTIASISYFFDCSSAPAAGSDKSSPPSSRDLLYDIQTQLDEIEASEAAGDRAYDQIQLLIQEIHQIHPRLEQRLAHAIKTFPPEIAKRNSANNDLLAMTIEASIVKVSLVRAQALKAVYNYQSPKNPDLHMKCALSAAYAKLKEDEQQMEEEERKLDRELAEYQTLLDMVDGGGSGGFRQVVADCARVEKETEECRRDLRRLG
ncbi:hypothetical protein C8R44DRAFT_983830, partial [Mycena epipterygia]